MLKVLGQEIADLEERKQYLLDNSDKVVEMDYHKAFDTDELAVKKTELAEKSIRISDLEEEIKDFKEEIGKTLKPLREEVKDLLADIKSKGRLVHEKCYQFLDEDERMVAFYNAEGILISSRPATRDELQKTIYADLRREGTNN